MCILDSRRVLPLRTYLSKMLSNPDFGAIFEKVAML